MRIKIGHVLKILGIPLFAAILFAPFTAGTPEYAQKENKRCLYCHVALGKPELNKAGEYYKKHETLVGYEELNEDKNRTDQIRGFRWTTDCVRSV